MKRKLQIMMRPIRFAWQRLTRGWDDRVIWSIDIHLAKQLPEWLMKLKDNGLSYPSEIEPKEWDEILDEIALGFQLYYRFQQLGEMDVEYKDALKNSFDLLHKWFEDLWD